MTQRHPNTTAMSLLLMSPQARWSDDFEGEVALVIESLFSEWTDERKADLYALLAEKVTPHMRLIDIEKVVSGALWDNCNNWGRR